MCQRQHLPASRQALAQADRLMAVVVQAALAARPVLQTTNHNLPGLNQSPSRPLSSTLPSHLRLALLTPESLAWRYVLCLQSSHYYRLTRCRSRSAHVVVYLSVMKPFRRIVPALLFLVLFIGQPLPADVRRTSNPADRGLTEADFPRVKMLAEDVYTYEALTGPEDDRYTTNTMFVVTSDGVLVADGQGSPEDTAALVETIGEITDQPVSHVIICSDHGDHTNGNAMFPESATFIAHRNSLPALERAAESGGVLPDTVIDDRLDVELGGKSIEIMFLGRAHTGGDLFVHLPDEKILFTTEVFLNHMFSGFRSAYTRDWIDAINKAEALNPDIYIPGHGFIDDADVLREEWIANKAHIEYVYAEVSRLHASGASIDEAIANANWGDYSNWSGADFQGRIAIRRIYAELNGELQ